jgi:uncharacterized protein (DUF362 family)
VVYSGQEKRQDPTDQQTVLIRFAERLPMARRTQPSGNAGSRMLLLILCCFYKMMPMKFDNQFNRRGFIKSSLMAGISAMVAGTLPTGAVVEAPGEPRRLSTVALTSGQDHPDNIFRGLQMFKAEIQRSIGNRRVVIKPNNVAIDNKLCATPAESLEGILEFLKSIGKTEVVIAESAANGPTLDGFDNYGYTALAGKYKVKLVDLDQQEVAPLYVFDETDFRPHAMRVAKMMMDPNNYIISAAKFKTHDRVVATLSLKNIVVGSPIKDLGFRWGQGSKPGAKNDKPITHGNGFRGINYNLFDLASKLHPDLAVIDGYEGMEGNGPVGGTPVPHRVAVVSPDWLAADRVAVELMGIDFAKIGYLNFCAQARMGVADLANLEVRGERLADHIKTYKLSDNIEKQLIWMTPAKKA